MHFGLNLLAQIRSGPDFVAGTAAVAGLIAVVLLWLPKSNEFMRSVKVDRRVHSKQLV